MGPDACGRPRSIILGLPKGRFLPNTQRLLKHLGLDDGSRALSFKTSYGGVNFVIKIMKMADIAYLLDLDLLDLGVLCDEWAYEHGLAKLHPDKLNWCQSTFALAASTTEEARPTREIRRVVSAYPKLARHLLREIAPSASILQLSGSAESTVPELADAIIDCVETGATLKANNLEPVRWLARTNVHIYRSPKAEIARIQAIANMIHSAGSLARYPVDLPHSEMVDELL